MSVCSARAGEEKKVVRALAARRIPHSSAEPLAGFGEARATRGDTRDRGLNIICCVVRRCGSIGVRCGVSVNPTLRLWIRRGTKRGGVGVTSTSAFSSGLAFQSNAKDGQEATPTITPRWKHRTKICAMATLSKPYGAGRKAGSKARSFERGRRIRQRVNATTKNTKRRVFVDLIHDAT